MPQESKYNPNAIEQKWQERWERENAFRAEDFAVRLLMGRLEEALDQIGSCDGVVIEKKDPFERFIERPSDADVIAAGEAEIFFRFDDRDIRICRPDGRIAYCGGKIAVQRLSLQTYPGTGRGIRGHVSVRPRERSFCLPFLP